MQISKTVVCSIQGSVSTELQFTEINQNKRRSIDLIIEMVRTVDSMCLESYVLKTIKSMGPF